MSSSHPQDRSPSPSPSPAKSAPRFAEEQRELWPTADKVAAPGSLNDAGLVRKVIVAAMHKCPLSRAEIADRMAYFTGTEVTERMLNAFAAESREDHRFPSQLERAFCAAVGDNTLLTCLAELAGLHFIDETGLALMELGREFLRQKRAAENLNAIETKLRGVDLG